MWAFDLLCYPQNREDNASTNNGRSLRGETVKKLIATILILMIFCLAGCGEYGKTVFLSRADNEIGLKGVYRSPGKVTLEFDGKYEQENNGLYYDITGYLENRNKDEDQLYIWVKTDKYRLFPESKISFDRDAKTISVDLEGGGSDIKGLMISFMGRQFGIDPESYSLLRYEIKPVKICRSGEHLYYPEDLFFRPKNGFSTSADKGDIQRCLDGFIEKTGMILEQDTYFYQYDYQTNGEGSDVTVWGNVFVNGAAVDITDTVAYSGDGSVGYDQTYKTEKLPDPDTSGLIDPMELVPEIAEFARKNKPAKMLNGQGLIYGDCLLRYDRIDDVLYYRFNLNEDDYVNVDPRTGEILAYEFVKSYADFTA